MGGCVGLGRENGRSNGGAVIVRSLKFLLKYRATLLFGFVLIANFTACSRQQAPAPDPAKLLQSIPAADPAKYPALQAAKHWENPYLVIRPDEVVLLAATDANEERKLKPGEVSGVLAHLPAAAWPYGRAVAILVDEKAAASEQDKTSLRRNRGIVEGDLEAAHVAIRWIPNA
jgi:hypothetical protein